MSRVLLLEAVARSTALQVMELVAECFREDEQPELYVAIHEIIEEGVQIYAQQCDRLARLSDSEPIEVTYGERTSTRTT